MPEQRLHWHIQPTVQPPEWVVQTIRQQVPGSDGRYAAQLLWQRGIQDAQTLTGFLNPQQYQPTSPFAFGPEMNRAIARLQQARTQSEAIAIWGDFDADGVTATAVLWDGLGQFFVQQKTLFYYIPNRLTESHGLSRQGIDILHAKNCRLIVTCDTGSTNLEEIEYALALGMDVIVTDHHTLPPQRPPVTAIINPRSLPADHPLASLSGVAVAYKLVEALYETLPQVPQTPLEQLLDLVAIGLIADLVELKGDCRYLAQRGIQQLQKQANRDTATRPGVLRLLELCKRTGDRATDISFGLGPRINAVSRIQGDAHFCVELLTSRDQHLCRHLAEATELANARRKALQNEVAQQVASRIAHLDLSTTRVIVLADEQWQLGVLGLVAGQVAQEYGRPTILLSLDETGIFLANQTEDIVPNLLPPVPAPAESTGAIARGSARSVSNIDLYTLVKQQEHLLHRFGGHPYAAGLSLPVSNIPLFTEAINQQLRQTLGEATGPSLQVDLTVTVAELGKALFQELKLLEPCGMGNPVPKLLIQNCWFEKVWNKKIQDWKGGKVQYIRTEFELHDDSATSGFDGIWWGHYKEDLPTERCDVVVELDFNAYHPRYEVRLIALQAQAASHPITVTGREWIRDRRGSEAIALEQSDQSTLLIHRCPSHWSEFQAWFRRAKQAQCELVIAYPPPEPTPPQEIWRTLVGLAKYLSRTGQTATRQQLLDKLAVSDHTLQLGLKTLTHLGFGFSYTDNSLQITWQEVAGISENPSSENPPSEEMNQFFAAVKEEQFRRQYFYQVPLAVIQAVAAQTG